MSVRVTMRQQPDGRWRATDQDHGIDLSAADRERCLDRVHQAVLGILPAVSWERGPPVVFLEVVPRLVGVTEAARILGWDKRRVATYVRRGSFPDPVESLAGGRVWLMDDVLAFAEAFRARQRTRGLRATPRSD
jgi:hypothetical protein